MEELKFRTEGDELIIELVPVINSSNAAWLESELFRIRGENPHESINLDASKLTYISSAGLRAILKLQKQQKNVSVLEASKEVYDIFEITGLTQLIPVVKRLREVSIEGLKKIGQGGTAAVYQLDEDKIIKVYKPIFPMDVIRKEKEISQKLFLAGVPTAVPYEVTKCGNELGVIYEMLHAKTLLELILSDPEHGKDYVCMMADFFKETSSIEMKDFPELKPMMIMAIGRWVKAGLIAPEEVGHYSKIYENIPDEEGFLHGDYHPGNIMKVEDELLMIDLSAASKGHKILDLAGLGTYLYSLATYMPPQRYTAFTGLSPEMGKSLWKDFIEYYLRDKGEEASKKAITQILVVSNMRVVSGAAAVPDLIPRESAAVALEFINENYEVATSPIEF